MNPKQKQRMHANANGTVLVHEVKCVIVGDGGVGKTTYLRRHLTGEFEKKYTATLGVEVHPLTFRTSSNQYLQFNCWDTAGQEKFGGLRDGYYLEAHCAIIMVDTTSRLTAKSVPAYRRQLKKMAGDIPILTVITKSDLTSKLTTNLPNSINISAKKNMQLEAPFLELAKQLGYMQETATEFLEMPAVVPPSASITAEEAAEYRRRME